MYHGAMCVLHGQQVFPGRACAKTKSSSPHKLLTIVSVSTTKQIDIIALISYERPHTSSTYIKVSMLLSPEWIQQQILGYKWEKYSSNTYIAVEAMFSQMPTFNTFNLLDNETKGEGAIKAWGSLKNSIGWS